MHRCVAGIATRGRRIIEGWRTYQQPSGIPSQNSLSSQESPQSSRRHSRQASRDPQHLGKIFSQCLSAAFQRELTDIIGPLELYRNVTVTGIVTLYAFNNSHRSDILDEDHWSLCHQLHRMANTRRKDERPCRCYPNVRASSSPCYLCCSSSCKASWKPLKQFIVSSTKYQRQLP
jgi:hypothetical protein